MYHQEYAVVEVIKKKKVNSKILKYIRKGLKSVKNYSGIKVNPKIIFSDKKDHPNLGEYWGIKKRRPIILIFTETLKRDEKSLKEITIRTIIHECLHSIFEMQKINRLLSTDEEEKLVDQIESEIWEKYFT